MTGKKWKRAAGPLIAVLSAVFLSACGDNLETFLPMTKNIGGNTGKEEKEQESRSLSPAPEYQCGHDHFCPHFLIYGVLSLYLPSQGQGGVL